MTKLGKVARVVVRGRDLPDVSGGELKNTAALVHMAAVERARLAHSPRILHTLRSGEQVEGFEWRGYVKSIINELWPSMPEGNSMHQDKEASNASEAIYRYLRETNNMICLERGLKTPSVWFVRGEWNEVPMSEHQIARRSVPTARTRVTAHEAGEDREPEPVKMRYKCPFCREVFESNVSRSAHIYTYARHVDLEKLFVKALRELPVPSSPRQVYTYLKERMKFLGSEGSVAGKLKEYSTYPSSDIVMARVTGRTSPTYTVKQRLGEMNEEGREYICREPGCGAGGFSTAYYRSAHEDTFHPGSPNRRWRCSVCDEKLYDKAPLSIHLRRKHGITQAFPETAEQYNAIMAKAEDEAAAITPRVVVDTWPTAARPQQQPEPEPKPEPEAEPKIGPEPEPEPETAVSHGSARQMLESFLAESDQLRSENKQLRAELEDKEKELRRLSKFKRMLQSLSDDSE